MSSIKTRKHYVIFDMVFSGLWSFFFFVTFGGLWSFLTRGYKISLLLLSMKSMCFYKEKKIVNWHSHIAIVVRPPSLKSFANQVVILKNPLQVTCDLQRVFQHDHSVSWHVFWFAKLFNDGGLTTIAIWEWLNLKFVRMLFERFKKINPYSSASIRLVSSPRLAFNCT